MQRLIGVLPDAHGLYVRLTAREHLRYVAELHALDAATIGRSIDRLVQLLDMREIIDRRVAGFSTGERMKVAVGRALVHDPPNLLLDEPTNGLDVMSTARDARPYPAAEGRGQMRPLLQPHHAGSFDAL